jgi:tRNA A-37 threonylcarbamoyl transferase component Bud32
VTGLAARGRWLCAQVALLALVGEARAAAMLVSGAVAEWPGRSKFATPHGCALVPIDFAGLREALAGRYALEREIGRGTFATVFLAQDLKVPTKVAVKVLNPDIALAVNRERFLTEIEHTTRLQHPYVLSIRDQDVAYDRQTGRELLYYVTEFMPGGSLAELIEREGPLPIDQAVQLATEVAEALAHAHDAGLIHRDIKPANILLKAGHVCVADFGIARAIGGDASVTDTGVRLGTPAYMAPEQITGDGPLDGRTDVYALGCVLYEMLAGKPPFPGGDIQTVLSQHLTVPAPPLRTVRGDVPEGVERIIQRALAKNPGQRLRTAGDVAAALRRGDVLPEPRASVTIRRVLAPVACMLVGFGLVTIPVPDVAGGRPGRAVVDTLRFAILPSRVADGVVPRRDLDALLRAAFGQWRGISLVDPAQLREALGPDAADVTASHAQATAVALGAGRYLRADAWQAAGMVRLHAQLFDVTRPGHVIREGSVRLEPGLRGAEPALERLSERLLFGDDSASRGTASVPARAIHQTGLVAVRSWDLARAESAFVVAIAADPDYAAGELWLAQVRYWSNAPLATWQANSERARAAASRLGPYDQLRGRALRAQARGDFVAACGHWARMTRAAPGDYASWYSLALCLHRDDAVEPDRASPSRRRFRTSYQEALNAYRVAFRLLPAMHRSLSGDPSGDLRSLLKLGGSSLRRGRGIPPDTMTYLARPTLAGDSLAFVPYPIPEVQRAAPWTVSPTTGPAIQRLRDLFHEIAAGWVAAQPASAEAMEALAVSLEMLGNPACLDTLRRARALASDPEEQLRVAGTEVWMRLKFAVPLDVSGVRQARRVADSLWDDRGTTPGRHARLLGSLAVLTGRASQAASLYQLPAAGGHIPAPLSRIGPALLVLASLGGPSDSLDLLEQRVAGAIEVGLPVSARKAARDEWLGRPATLAFPDYRLASTTQLPAGSYNLLDAQAAFARGDSAGARRILADVRERRRHLSPQDITLDALYPEAALLAAMGDEQAAAQWLDPTLHALAGTAPLVFIDPGRAGALVRAMALRADLAHRAGERATAARWARVVLVLWSDADAFLDPLVARMQRLTR